MEFIMRTSGVKFPEKTYTYENKNRTEKEYDSGLSWKYKAYNKDMTNNILFIKNSSGNYQEIVEYFKKVEKEFTRIEKKKKKLSGMPVIKNTRIPVSLIVACIKDEMTFEEICQEYQLEQEDMEQAMEYIIELLDVPYQEG